MLATIYANVGGKCKSVTVDTRDPIDAHRKWEQLLAMIRGEEPAKVPMSELARPVGTKVGKLERNRRRAI